MKIMNDGFERIRLLFDESWKSDSDLEREIGIPAKKISQWRIGYTKSYTKYIPKISAYFHVSTDYLLGLKEDPIPAAKNEKPPAQGGELSPLDKRLNELLLVASDDTKRLMIGLLERLQTQ